MKASAKHALFSIVVIVLCLAALYYSFTSIVASMNDEKYIEGEQAARVANYQASVASRNASIQKYAEQRDFNVDYKDVSGICKFIEGSGNFTVKNVQKRDSLNDFKLLGFYEDGDDASAVTINLSSREPVLFLYVVQVMQLPVYSVEYDSVGDMSLTFLTGGELVG